MNFKEFCTQSCLAEGVTEEGCIEHFKLLYEYLESQDKIIEEMKNEIKKLKLEIGQINRRFIIEGPQIGD